ncbi:unnamed protein product [Haemonchus placei]|uniref:Uncharacterized protein n=1 Tax=Haemonchus placei TaxID=6290 RepID=A0A0N4XBZ1_HAEPC|nr:unnamed protein product [Haemonchus placei]
MLWGFSHLHQPKNEEDYDDRRYYAEASSFTTKCYTAHYH